jgi:hypothetical protein
MVTVGRNRPATPILSAILDALRRLGFNVFPILRATVATVPIGSLRTGRPEGSTGARRIIGPAQPASQDEQRYRRQRVK